MFGLSFGELVVLAIVAIVVVGPKNLPTLMRTLGQWMGRVRRMATDIRTESGIDDMLELDGLRSEIHNFRRLASGELLLLEDEARRVVKEPDRAREYPRIGVDSYDAISEDDAPYLATEADDASRSHPADASRFQAADGESAPVPSAAPTALLAELAPQAQSQGAPQARTQGEPTSGREK